MALDVSDRAYLDVVLAAAERLGQLASLCAKLDWLDGYQGRANSRCVLSPAPAVYGFDLVMFERVDAAWRPAFVGRLLLLTPDPRDGVAAPTFAVAITAICTPGDDASRPHAA